MDYSNQLSTVRQLTPIRLWRWGKLGSLFLIGKSETSHPLYVIRLVKPWDKYRTQLRYAKEADEKAAMYLRWAAGK